METYIFTYNYSYVSYENYINSPVLQKGENVICYGKIDEIQNDKVKLSLVYALNTQGAKKDYSYSDVGKYPCEYTNSEANVKGVVENIKYDYENNKVILILNSEGNFYAIENDISSKLSQNYVVPESEKKEVMRKYCDTLPNIGDTTSITGIYQGVYKLKGKDSSPIIPAILVENMKGYY